MAIITPEQITVCPKKFAAMWSLWKYKGHNPAQKLSVFEVHNKDIIYYSVGLLDYETLENYYYPSHSLFTNYEQAFADIGRALDANL